MIRKFLMLFVCLFVIQTGFSQSKFSINVNGGYDLNLNKFYNDNGYAKFEDAKTDYNYGVDVAYRLTDWFRFRVEFRFVELSYGQCPTTDVELVQSEMTLSGFDINPRLDFRIFSKNKFELFASPGLRLEYYTDSDQLSLFSDGDESTRNYIDTDYNESMSGLITGLIFKYNFNKHLGLSFSPDYTLFFEQLYYQNTGVMHRFNVNAGIDWTF